MLVENIKAQEIQSVKMHFFFFAVLLIDRANGFWSSHKYQCAYGYLRAILHPFIAYCASGVEWSGVGWSLVHVQKRKRQKHCEFKTYPALTGQTEAVYWGTVRRRVSMTDHVAVTFKLGDFFFPSANSHSSYLYCCLQQFHCYFLFFWCCFFFYVELNFTYLVSN